jgi:hypothetical protein
MSKRSSLVLSCLFACCLSSVSAQVTNISTVDPVGGSTGWNYFNAFADMAAWTQLSSHSQVSISALVDGGDGTTTGTFYLMTQVGPGTTTASELAHASFSVTGSTFAPQLVTLFSGLTLGPGTYYLVGAGSGPGGWVDNTLNQTPVTAPDVSMAINNFRAQVYDPYPPANSFMSYYPGIFPYNLEYIVSEVPEPSALTLLGISLLIPLVSRSCRLLNPKAAQGRHSRASSRRKSWAQ